ncbi:MAG: hypothetical protein OEY44_05145, partial [Candidatus Peregrinibacteria bacterium]|nr:hypothetical protein [Candidatus Peregrinibacteria bacterium]
EGLASYDGTRVSEPINKGFKGYNLGLAQHRVAAYFADLNGDGRVDFADFTIFSSVYGTVYAGTGSNVEEATADAASAYASGTSTTSSGGISGAGQPIVSNPDATVPITTVPAGGEI